MCSKKYLVIQGPLVSNGINSTYYFEGKYNNKDMGSVTFQSKDQIEFYRELLEYFDDIVFSTWEGEEPFGDFNFIFNKKVPPASKNKNGLINNGNLQSISSLAGSLYFQEKHGDNCTIVKIRTDIKFEVDVFFNAINFVSPKKIYPSYLMGLCTIDDFIIAGDAGSLISFFESSLITNQHAINISHFDYVCNHLQEKGVNLSNIRELMHPYMFFSQSKRKEVSDLAKSFRLFFEPLFSRSQFDLLNLEWRGTQFNSHSLYKYHFDQQMFKGDFDYFKKHKDCSEVVIIFSYMKLKLKKIINFIKQIKTMRKSSS